MKPWMKTYDQEWIKHPASSDNSLETQTLRIALNFTPTLNSWKVIWEKRPLINNSLSVLPSSFNIVKCRGIYSHIVCPDYRFSLASFKNFSDLSLFVGCFWRWHSTDTYFINPFFFTRCFSHGVCDIESPREIESGIAMLSWTPDHGWWSFRSFKWCNN